MSSEIFPPLLAAPQYSTSHSRPGMPQLRERQPGFWGQHKVSHSLSLPEDLKMVSDLRWF